MIPPSLMTSPPIVPTPETVPCWILTVPPAVVSLLLIASVPAPVFVSVWPLRLSALLKANDEPPSMFASVLLCRFTSS